MNKLLKSHRTNSKALFYYYPLEFRLNRNRSNNFKLNLENAFNNNYKINVIELKHLFFDGNINNPNIIIEFNDLKSSINFINNNIELKNYIKQEIMKFVTDKELLNNVWIKLIIPYSHSRNNVLIDVRLQLNDLIKLKIESKHNFESLKSFAENIFDYTTLRSVSFSLKGNYPYWELRSFEH